MPLKSGGHFSRAFPLSPEGRLTGLGDIYGTQLQIKYSQNDEIKSLQANAKIL